LESNEVIAVKISELKSLMVSAKNELNGMLALNRSKKIKYEQSQYFDLVTFLSLWNVAGEGGSEVMNVLDDVPSGDALLQQLKKLNLQEVEKQFELVSEKQFRKMFGKKPWKKKAIAIIDVHEQETYSKERKTSKDIRGGKQKNGTNYFFKFATIQIVIKNKILTLKVNFQRRGMRQKDIVEQLVKYAQRFVKIKVLLLDRGFRDVDIINELEFLRVPLLMPCVKDKKVKKEFLKLLNSKKTINYSLCNTRRQHADVRLVMIRLVNGKEIGFYTTIPLARWRSIQYFLDLYAKRWNIETGYRLQNQFLPRTTSIKGVVRYFYFCYAVAMHNLWLCLRSKIPKTTKLTILATKFILVYHWITTHLNPHL
jgi:hypothetical protein